ncbi:MAG: hypothetical protein HRU15_20975, partial [Planctomycetes bacterium]|nr:hypothetical protein [Planctomycetota bacterium]
MFKKLPIFCLLFALSAVVSAEDNALGKRNLANLDAFSWNKEFSTANARIMPSGQTRSGKGQSLHIASHFSGTGFTYYNCSPIRKESSLPGSVKKFRIVAKTGGDSVSWKVSFSVKDQQKGETYEWSGLKLSNDWQESSFDIPADWPPVLAVNVSANNWDNKTNVLNGDLFIDTLEVFTDLSAINDRASLLAVHASTNHERNLFAAGQPIQYTVTAGSWLQEMLTGSWNVSIIDPRGETVHSENKNIELLGSFRQEITHQPKIFGVYTVKTVLDFGDGLSFSNESQCASIPTAPTYSHEDQRYAPWAINIHGGMEGVAYKSIRQLGFQWIRNYAYNYQWLSRGRGNGDWGGWPWFLPMEDKRAESGLMLLPSMVHGIGENIKKHPHPSSGWMDNVVHLILKFPQYHAFEIDNEVDLHYPKIFAKDDFHGYGLYHAAFAKILKALRPNAWAVEQGPAGIKADVVRKAISRGHFDDIDVVNSHFYCGVSPAMMAKQNANTGQAGDLPGNIFDQLRGFVEAADSDGKDRQAWLTEFGWDTLAVHIVDEHTQASFTQRGFALGLHAGLDKLFLYWNRDTKGEPNTFFDGMGIFDPQDEPKP